MKFFKVFFTIAIIPGFTLVMSCGDDDNNSNCLNGSGNTVSETRMVDTFNSVTAAIVGNVFITQGSPQELRIVTHQNVLDELITTVSSGTLEMRFDRCQDNIATFDVFITMEDIESVIQAGVGNITSQNDWNVDNLAVTLAGVGNMDLSGNVNDLNINLAGVGDVKTYNIPTSTCTVTLVGVGDVEVTVTTTLNVILSGVGDVKYRGSPNVNASITGTGNVIDDN